MPVYNTQVKFEVKKDGIYEITYVNEMTTRNGLTGIVVDLKAKDEKDKRNYAVTLWPSEIASATSKFGSFVAVLGDDTDNWLHKWVKINNWMNRLCEIQLIPAPKISLKQQAERLADSK